MKFLDIPFPSPPLMDLPTTNILFWNDNSYNNKNLNLHVCKALDYLDSLIQFLRLTAKMHLQLLKWNYGKVSYTL